MITNDRSRTTFLLPSRTGWIPDVVGLVSACCKFALNRCRKPAAFAPNLAFMGSGRWHIAAISNCLVGVALFASATCMSSGAYAEETSHLVFVTEYVRELSENENARAAAEQELSTAKTTNEFLTDAIHSSTVIQLELVTQIRMLRGMHLGSPFDALIPAIIELDQHKIALHQRMIDIAGSFLAGPKPNVDYGKMTAEMPKIRALLDETDHALFETTPLVFATLIDQKPDPHGHVSHLVITRAERDQLVNELAMDFGKKLKQKDQVYMIASASVLYTYLTKKGYKCADDPW